MRLQKKARGFSSFAYIALLLFLSVASTPQAQASSISEKYPTETSVVVAGWNDPTNAYAGDDNIVYTETNGANQAYYGFGFNFNSTDTIDKVYLKCDLYCTGGTDVPDSNKYIYFYYYVYNGTTLKGSGTFYASGITFSGAGDWAIIESGYKVYCVDITSIAARTTLNNLKVRIRAYTNYALSDYWEFDYVSVIVSYSVPVEETANLLPVGFLLGVIIVLPIGILLSKKH